MAETGLRLLRQVFGDDAIYTPATTPPAQPAPVATWAMLTQGSAFVGQYGERMETRILAEMPKAAVGTPQPGDSLTIGATTYRIDQVTADDGLIVTVALR